jgi:hypothetical protein
VAYSAFYVAENLFSGLYEVLKDVQLGQSKVARLNEMGITSPLQPNENKSSGRDVSQFDEVADPEDEAQLKPNLSTSKPTKPDDFLHPFGEDVEAFARFMRSTKVPPRDFATGRVVDRTQAAASF